MDGTQTAPTITWSSSVACFARVSQFSGAHNSDPIGAVSNNTGTGTPHTNPGITTTAADSLVVYLGAGAVNTAYGTPTGYTKNTDEGNATGGYRYTIGSKTVATAGTDSGALSVSGGTAAWVLVMLELLAPVVSLTVGDGAHAHSAEGVTLVQVHVLTVADGAHAHSAEGVTLEQVHVLTVADGAHAHSAEGMALGQVHVLAVGDGAHGHSAEGVTLTVTHVLAVGDGTHGHSAEGVTLAVLLNLVVADGAHAHSAERGILSRTYAEVFDVKRREVRYKAPERAVAFDVPERVIEFVVR